MGRASHSIRTSPGDARHLQVRGRARNRLSLDSRLEARLKNAED
jgi:hypothetical protein